MEDNRYVGSSYRKGRFQVYNFQVEGLHNYYVSELGVLAHNNCAARLKASSAIPQPNTHEPIEPADIAALEQHVGLTLPKVFVDFLLAGNGGAPKVDTFFTDRGSWAINNLFFVGPDDKSTETIQYNMRNKWSGASPWLLPFARDGGGNLFCLDLAEDTPPVVFWDHEDNSTTQIAGSFEVLIDGLRENPDYI